MKLCPYNIVIGTSQKVEYEYDENNNMTVLKLKETQTQVPTQCYEELCGAWQDGKCCYGKG